MKLFTASNAKVAKGSKKGYLNIIMHLAPFNLSGKNVCPNASKGCASACLNTAGRGRFSNVQDARIKKTLRFFNERAEFMALAKKDIESAKRKADREGKILAVRPNGTSDIPMLSLELAKAFPEIQFYDYTKNPKTFNRELPKNYHLTFSRSETNEKDCIALLKRGFNVAVVFDKLPKKYLGFNVVNGDDTDLRFLDKKGVIVGLTAKGKAKKDESGFVVKSA